MRKNCARKILHAVLDLLPLIILPIFAMAVRSDNNYEPISTTISGYEVTPKYQTNEVNDFEDIILGNVYHVSGLDLSIDEEEGDFGMQIVSCEGFDNLSFNQVDETFISEYSANNENYIYVSYDVNVINIYFSNAYGYQQVLVDEITLYEIDFIIDYNIENAREYLNDYVYENPTASTYQDYEVVFNDSIVLDKTDVGSQMMYSLYIPIHDHFNFMNVLNFGDIYNWIQLNMFGGTAPMSIYIVYNIIVYEFIMDLIFLMYSVFMFIIDFTTNLLEHFLSWSKSGGSRKL